MYAFRQLLSRADDETLQELVGRSTVRLLDLLDPSLSRPTRLRQLLLDTHEPAELLRRQSVRALLFPLLPPQEAGELAASLDIAGEGSPYPALISTSVRKGSSREARLLEFFGVVRPQKERAVPDLPSAAAVPTMYGQFSHQRTAVRQAQAALGRPPHRAVLHMPTGSGKTRTALNLIAQHLRSSEPAVVVWLAYSEELCEQTIDEFDRAWRHLGDRDLSVFRYFGNHSVDVQQIHDGLFVGGLQKLYTRAKRDHQFLVRLADRTTLVVIDEAHQAIAETYRFVLETLVMRDFETALLGLTATPGRTWNDVDVDEQLSNFFGRTKITLEIDGHSSPVDYLIEQEYLARPHFSRLTYQDEALSARDLEELAKSLDVPPSILRKLAEDEQRNLLIVQRLEDLLRRHRRSIVFAATVEHARLLAGVLKARGIDAAAITGDMPTAERTRQIAAYKANDEATRVLVNFGVLTTGFDAPNTSACLIARPTKSLVLYSQMVGRATRGPRAGGNKNAEIVTVVDTSLPGFADISAAFSNWEDVWND